MRTRTLLGAATAALALVTVSVASPVDAITRGGELDGADHPYVGLMVADDADGNPMWRCSGALVSPTVFVTAGHCTFDADGAELWFNTDLHSGPTGAPSDFGYPLTGEVSGTPYAHPEYVDAGFFLFDLGVVVLDEPVVVDRYASIADLGTVDGFTSGRRKSTSKVTAVGYGLQEIVEGPAGVGPDFDPKLQQDKTRYQADLLVVDTNGVAGIGALNPDQSFTMSGDAKHGGTCFGDSGGPILQYGTDVIVGVNSFGLNSNCAGIGGAYRVDQQDDYDFLAQFIDLG